MPGAYPGDAAGFGRGQGAAPAHWFTRSEQRGARTSGLRLVLVPGLTDPEQNVACVTRFAASLGNVSRVDVLPFHRLGAAEYQDLGERFALADTPSPTPEQVAAARAVFTAEGLDAV